MTTLEDLEKRVRQDVEPGDALSDIVAALCRYLREREDLDPTPIGHVRLVAERAVLQRQVEAIGLTRDQLRAERDDARQAAARNAEVAERTVRERDEARASGEQFLRLYNAGWPQLNAEIARLTAALEERTRERDEARAKRDEAVKQATSPNAADQALHLAPAPLDERRRRVGRPPARHECAYRVAESAASSESEGAFAMTPIDSESLTAIAMKAADDDEKRHPSEWDCFDCNASLHWEGDLPDEESDFVCYECRIMRLENVVCARDAEIARLRAALTKVNDLANEYGWTDPPPFKVMNCRDAVRAALADTGASDGT